MSAVTAKSAPSPAERYRATFEARWQGSDPLLELRRGALEQFIAAGFPTQRDEDWKYTNLRRLEMRAFAPADATALAVDAYQQQWLANVGTRIVLVNGRWMPTLSSAIAQPPGVTIVTLGQWQQHDAAQVASYLTQRQPAASSALEQLNLAFSEDGVVIDVADDVALDEPVYIVHQWNAAAAQRMSHPRVIVTVGRRSRCTVIEHYLGAADVEYFTNTVTNIDVGDGSSVRHFRMQQESLRSFHIGHVHARVARDARYSVHDLSMGAGLGRVNITALLEGSGAHAELRGLLLPVGTQHVDSHTRIDHIAPHTTSEEDYRGIASDRGRGVFNGKVIVRPGAQKIDARQSSRNLLLSAAAEIDTKPELEIYANDVKCSHGATTGQLDATALFYLRSRGVSENEARALLIRAFAESILSTIDLPALRSALERQIDARFTLPSGAST